MWQRHVGAYGMLSPSATSLSAREEDLTMLVSTGTLLVFLAVLCVAFEAIGSATVIGAMGMWMVSHGT